jgi:hypothetical protein
VHEGIADGSGRSIVDQLRRKHARLDAVFMPVVHAAQDVEPGGVAVDSSQTQTDRERAKCLDSARRRWAVHCTVTSPGTFSLEEERLVV